MNIGNLPFGIQETDIDTDTILICMGASASFRSNTNS